METNNNSSVVLMGYEDLRSVDLPRIQSVLQENLSKFNVQSVLIGIPDSVNDVKEKEDAENAAQLIIKLAGELNIEILDLETAAGTASVPAQLEYLINHYQHIIAVWDGVYTGKKGDISDIVHNLLKSEKTVQIYQLVCPSQTNPYPVAALLDQGIDFEKGKFSRIPFVLPFSWISYSIQTKAENRKTKRLWDNNFRNAFVIPGVFACITLFCGAFGFHDIYDDGIQNNIYRALNLITLNSSVIESGKYAGCMLNIARITGVLTAFLAIGFALYAATEKKRKHLTIKRWGKNKNFVLVMGLNRKSFDLIADLSLNHHKNVVVLYPNEQNTYLNEVKNLPNVIAVQGNLFSGTTLKSIGAINASKVFIMGDTDTENIRGIQELDIADTVKPEPSKTDRFVHLEEESKRRFLHNSLCRTGQNRTNIFNVYENSVRRLLLYYPIDRFYQNPDAKHSHAIIIGFDKLGKQLLLTLLKQGHYSRDKYLHITVYCKGAEEEEKQFQKGYPQFRKIPFETVQTDKDIYAYTWSNIKLIFEEIPASDVQWLDEKNQIFSAIQQNRIFNLYACLEDGIQSATYLSSLLPKIDFMNQEANADVQVFCYYNFPDKKEEAIIENHFNAIVPHTFVKCFGNYIDECSASSIQGMALDALPKLINAAYNKKELTDYEVYDKAESLWQNLSEKDKVSNRQAADHLWTKIRLVWPTINWKYNPKTFEPDPEVADLLFGDKILQEYGEIEHRRWCADLLLQGFVPFEHAYGSSEYDEDATRWENDKIFKNRHQEQKKHISLVPYKHLTTKNQERDINQIKEIPEFLRRVINTNNL